MKIVHIICLTLLTLLGCHFGSDFVLFYAMFMVTDNPAWNITVPIGIIVINVLSLPLYINTLVSGWRYLYNICVTLLVTTISFYGAIEWTNSIHAARGSMGLLIAAIVGVALAISGIFISIKMSRR